MYLRPNCTSRGATLIEVICPKELLLALAPGALKFA
jgi:hypothetical protein